MTERHLIYLEELRVRHNREYLELKRILAGRRPRLLARLRRRHGALERETQRILMAVEGRSA